MANKLEFKCPQCDGHKIIETMVDTVVHSEISIVEKEVDETGLGGVWFRYGDQTNEDGHVDRYACCDCGFLIVDGDSPHADDGLDDRALAKALKELANPSKTRPLEMGICKGDGTWYADVFIDIPDDTPDEKIEAVAQEITLKHPCCFGEDIAHVFVYNTMEDSRPE